MERLSDRWMYYCGVLAMHGVSVDDMKHIQNLIDAEEQGLLLKLPCKVGDTVWCLEEDGYAGYVFLATSGEYYIVSAHYTHCDNINKQLEEMEDDTENWGETNVSVFHKSRVFLTKAEAVSALEEMEK